MLIRQKLTLAAATALIASGAAGLVVNATLQGEPTPAGPSAVAEAVGPSPSPDPAPTPSVTPTLVTESPADVVEPVLDITVTDTMPFTPTLEPATYEGVYRIVDEDAGYSTDLGSTTYLLTHARTPWRGHSPGNDWLEVAEADRVTVDGRIYLASTVMDVAKGAIGDAPIWEHVRGRVVLITCVPRIDGDTATQNRIIILETS